MSAPNFVNKIHWMWSQKVRILLNVNGFLTMCLSLPRGTNHPNSMPIEHQSHAFKSDRYLIVVDRRGFAIWAYVKHPALIIMNDSSEIHKVVMKTIPKNNKSQEPCKRLRLGVYLWLGICQPYPYHLGLLRLRGHWTIMYCLITGVATLMCMRQ